MDLGRFGLFVWIQVSPEQRAKSSGVWGGATEPDHEEGLGRGQPLLDIEVRGAFKKEDHLEGLTSTLAEQGRLPRSSSPK